MKYVQFDDYQRDGHTDYTAYRKAQVANGERCSLCDSFIAMPSGKVSVCYHCKDIGDEEELTHHKFIRCPKCKGTFDPYENETYDVLEDGEHDLICPSCDHEFTITTQVSYSFVSPAVGP